MVHFNSIKVRLKPIVNPIFAIAYEFQFHKGTIETLRFEAAGINPYNFNSIKVRLKPHLALLDNNYKLFQFHKGTIETRYVKGR